MAWFLIVQLFALALIIDELGMSPFVWTKLMIPLCFYLLCMGLMFFTTNLQSYFQQNLKSFSYVGAKKALYSKKYRMNYILNEDQQILNTFNLLDDFDELVVDYVKSLVFFITLFFQLLFLFILISLYSVTTALLVCLFSFIVLVLVAKGGNATYEANKKVQPLERKKKAIEDVLVDFSYGEERNLFHFEDFLCLRYNKQAAESRKHTNKALLIWFFKAQYGGITFIVLTLIVTLFLSLSLYKNEIGFGLFVSLFTAFVQLSDLMSWNLSDNVDSYINSLSKMKDYLMFLNLDETEFIDLDNDSKHNHIVSIDFKNVSFTYPKSDKAVLNNVNLIFKAGRKYAIVGENGCGKTTIIKLLLGLYSNYSGSIHYKNSNSELLLDRSFLNDMCVVFQDFSNYFISIRDFLQLGTRMVITEEKIISVFKMLNIDLNIDTLSNGLDTPLGNILDEGTNLSGGQWQKLCLARAILSQKSVIILDEPTSAADPLSEMQIMDTFKDLCKEKTLIFITHRLSIVKDTDEIFVIDGGEVIENATHDELMCTDSLYKKMFETQKSWYKNELGGESFEGKNKYLV